MTPVSRSARAGPVKTGPYDIRAKIDVGGGRGLPGPRVKFGGLPADESDRGEAARGGASVPVADRSVSAVRDEPAPADRRESGADLAARWDEPAGEGTTRRAAALEALREKGAARAGLRDLRGIRLIGEDLTGVDLSGADLSFAELSRADLTGAKLMGSKLTGAKLFGARLDRAELLGADLSGADLSESSAERAGFGNASLSGATLFNADLTGATLTKATLARADLRAVRLAEARAREVVLSHANLERARLSDADLERSVVDHATFDHADLRRARIRGVNGHGTASWVGADIDGVHHAGAYLVLREIRDQNYLHEFRTASRLNAALYWVWWATSDCGRSFLRWGLWTVLIAAVFAGLFRFAEFDYGEHETALSSVYYSVVTLTTLGYGDVLPASTAAQLLAMAEVAIGYVMLGGLMSIFANKMARRAD